MDPQLSSHPDDQRAVVPVANTSQIAFALPAETIYHILRFLDPQDLIRLRAVSKLFHAIIHDPAVWRTLYSIIPLPLLPGPFPWQSIHFLQRALVHSARLARTWTTEPLTLLSKRVFTGPRTVEDDRFKWVRGRWLIVSKDMKQLWSRDVETGSERMLWDHGAFSSWSTTSVMNSLGHFIYVVVHLDKGRLSDPVRLVEFVVDNDTGRLTGPEIINVPIRALPKESFVPHVRLNSGIAPYAYVSLCSANKPRQSLIFDPRRRQFYKFPRFRTRLDLLLNYRGAWLPHLVEVYLTETHLLVLNRSYLIHGYLGNVEVVQTFAFPDADPDSGPNPGSSRDASDGGLADSDDGNGNGNGNRNRPPVVVVVRELRLTHEFLSRDTGSLWLTPIRSSIVDPVTGTTTLRFMHTYAPFQPDRESRVRLVCTDYILHPPPPPSPLPPGSSSGRLRTVAAGGADADEARRPRNPNPNPNSANDALQGVVDTSSFSMIVRSAEPVVPITVVSHDVFSVQGVWNGNLVDVSREGFVRGLCMVGTYPGESEVPELGVVHKFSVDATGDRCLAAVGDPCLPWEGLDTMRYYEYTLDGIRGRMWHTKGDVLQMDSKGQPVDVETLAIVFDFN